MTQAHYVRWFSEIGIGDVPLVGGKNASLGEMYTKLAAEGLRVPERALGRQPRPPIPGTPTTPTTPTGPATSTAPKAAVVPRGRATPTAVRQAPHRAPMRNR